MLLFALLFCAVLFLALDWFYTTRVRAAALQVTGKGLGCFTVRDPTRVFALKPDCSCIRAWGGERYRLVTNSLGFRDQQIREIPPIGTKARVLMLGDSFTEGMVAWNDSFVGQLATNFPQYDFLNGGVGGYSPSNYLNTARVALSAGVNFDEAIVFIDISDAQDEASFYQDASASGAVAVPHRHFFIRNWYSNLRMAISEHFLLTNYLFEIFEKALVRFGYYHLDRGNNGNEFDFEKSAWTYRPVSNTLPFEMGFGPLGLDGGITKEKSKMNLLWQELAQRGIPISVVVYPYPAQIVHDTVDSRQVRIWREWCEGKCKRFITVFPAFLAAKEQCSRWQPGCWYLKYFIFGDIHYNAAGNALVAQEVGRSLSGQPVVQR
ncbi:MAG TPA: hypothetical protein VMT15_21990 [Bryobacteraceae bacterium]|nr:hypothetical protein [Bryobacteraceae bacterium]